LPQRRNVAIGGPNYTPINNDFVYQIHIDNDGDAQEDITFQFITGYRYVNSGRGIEVTTPQGAKVPLPISHVAGGPFGPIAYNATSGATSNLNTHEYYRVRVLKDRNYGVPIENGPFASRQFNGKTSYEFTKAYAYAGTKSYNESTTVPGDTSKYDAYVSGAAIYNNVKIPGCAVPATFFVGPRREAFGISLGEVFDAINIDGTPVFDLGKQLYAATLAALRRCTTYLTNVFFFIFSFMV
jgi:hypothetical protein